jgi:UDP-N-acetylglucosamine 1-carboxyvinyltransferase
MGADIRTEENTAIIRGVKELTGARVRASDLRAGAALIIAGLSAQGKTIVTENEHVERGYENIDKKLSQNGCPDLLKY